MPQSFFLMEPTQDIVRQLACQTGVGLYPSGVKVTSVRISAPRKIGKNAVGCEKNFKKNLKFKLGGLQKKKIKELQVLISAPGGTRSLSLSGIYSR
jgi:hypothetical protein